VKTRVKTSRVWMAAPGATRDEGITLIEVMVALTIIAVMGVISLEAVRLGSSSWERAEQRAEVDQRMRVVFDILSHEIGRLEPVMIKVEGKRVAAFLGTQEKVVFYSAPNASLATPSAGMLRGLTVFVQDGKGLVIRESEPLVDGHMGLDPGGRFLVVDPYVTRIQFRYFAPPSKDDPSAHWVNDWDPVERVAATTMAPGRPSSRGLLPSTVEASMTIVDEQGTHEHRFLFPVRVGRYLL